MFNKTKRVLAILLALAMIFALAGCSKPQDDGSSVEYIIEEETVYVEGEGSGSGDSATTSTVSKDPSGTSSKEDNDGGSTGNGIDGILDEVNPEDYRGKTIKFAATIAPELDESGPVVEKFEKDYGIKVEIVQSDQSNYANQLAGWIAAGNSPDVARCNGDFPTCMGYLQSLDAAKLDYESDFWNHKTLEVSTFGGSPYLCDSINNIWAEIDIVVYVKSLLKRAGASTPEEYDANGKWTWDAYFDICQKVKDLGPNMQGGGFASRENAIYGMGGGLIVYENGKFVSGVNERTQEAMIKYTTAWKKEIIGWESTNGMINGTVGISTMHAWVLKKTGFFQGTGFNMQDLGFYYLPRWDENSEYGCTGQVRGWGIVRGANEPVASGLFLREYLDVNNYDTDATFISEEAKEFFFKVTSINYDNWNPCIVYLQYQDGIANTTFDEHNNAMSGDPSQVGTAMASIRSCMEKAAENINKFVEQNTGLR